MTIFLTADHHFGHKLLARLRNFIPPFTGDDEDVSLYIEQHDEFLVDCWNSVVGPHDTVYHLGDFTLNATRNLHYVQYLNGHKILIAGNHDQCWTKNPSSRRQKKALASIPLYYEVGFEEVVHSGYGIFELEPGLKVMLSHLPASGDHMSQDRFSEARPPFTSHIPFFCGHVHDAWEVNRGQVNVGVDVTNLYPITLEQAYQIWRDHVNA